MIGLVAAALAALAYGTATVLQAQAVAHVGPGTALLRRLLLQRRYLAGLSLDLVGFGAAAFALRSQPLFLVQASLAASVGVTALLSRLVFGVTLRRPDIAALVALGVGLLLMAASAQEGPAHPVGPLVGWLLLAGAILLAVAAPWAVRHSGALTAVVAGLAGGAAGISARVLVLPDPIWHVLASPTALALAAFGLLCAWTFAEALQATSVTIATAVCFAVSTVVPAIVGLTFLGDLTRPGRGLAAGLGVVVVVLGTISLARFSAPAAGSAGTGPAAGPVSTGTQR